MSELKYGREAAPLCLKRVANGSWCIRDDNHDGICIGGGEPVYGPIEQRPEGWRRHRGMKQLCDKPVGDHWCRGEKGHSGPCV